MNKRENTATASFTPITVDIFGLQQLLSVGKSTAAKIADAADAVVADSIGRRKVYNVAKIQAYIDAHTGKGGN